MSFLILVGCMGASLPLLASTVAHADGRQEAHRHFAAGALAFDELRFADAAAEFEQAYAQAPAWQVLYNLGTVYAALGRPVQAAAALDHYLEQADDSVEPERRRQVQAEIAKQRAKIGLLELRVDVVRAEVRVDGQSVGRSPLSEPIQLAAGSHLVEVSFVGLPSQSREAVVAGGQRKLLDVRLSPAHQPSETASPTAAADYNAESDSGSVHRILGFSLGGAGLVGVAVGALVAGLGQGKHNDALDLSNRGQWPAARAREAEADRQKTLGFATIGVSAAFVVAGAALVLLAPDAPPATATLRVTGWASTTSAGAVMRRSW